MACGIFLDRLDGSWDLWDVVGGELLVLLLLEKFQDSREGCLLICNDGDKGIKFCVHGVL